jgi:hypothetical protein
MYFDRDVTNTLNDDDSIFDRRADDAGIWGRKILYSLVARMRKLAASYADVYVLVGLPQLPANRITSYSALRANSPSGG